MTASSSPIRGETCPSDREHPNDRTASNGSMHSVRARVRSKSAHKRGSSGLDPEGSRTDGPRRAIRSSTGSTGSRSRWSSHPMFGGRSVAPRASWPDMSWRIETGRAVMGHRTRVRTSIEQRAEVARVHTYEWRLDSTLAGDSRDRTCLWSGPTIQPTLPILSYRYREKPFVQ